MTTLDLAGDRRGFYDFIHRKLTKPDAWESPASSDPRVLENYLRDWERYWTFLGIARFDLHGDEPAGIAESTACFAEAGASAAEKIRLRPEGGSGWFLYALFAASARGKVGLQALGEAHLASKFGQAPGKAAKDAEWDLLAITLARAAVGDLAEAKRALASLKAMGPFKTVPTKTGNAYWACLLALTEEALVAKPAPEKLFQELAAARAAYWKDAWKKLFSTQEFFGALELGILALSVQRGWKLPATGSGITAIPLELLSVAAVEPKTKDPLAPTPPAARLLEGLEAQALAKAPKPAAKRKVAAKPAARKAAPRPTAKKPKTR